MDISFDADKDATNLAKHKLPLSFREDVLTNKHGEVEDQRRDYGETDEGLQPDQRPLVPVFIYDARHRRTHHQRASG